MAATLLSKQEFGSRISVSQSSVNRGIDKGLFACVRIGGRVLIPSSEVDRLIGLACAGGSDAPVVEAGK